MDDDLTLSARPDALVLFSAALFEPTFVPGRFDPQFYAVNHVQSNVPPMLIMHGSDDSHFPLPQMERFRDAMVAAGNQCELKVYPGEHGFAKYDRDDHRPYHATRRRGAFFDKAWYTRLIEAPFPTSMVGRGTHFSKSRGEPTERVLPSFW